MAYGREFGPASPATGDPLSAGSDSRVSTGSKAFDADGMQKSESYRPVIVKDGQLVPYVKK